MPEISPCISVCILGDDDICIGCNRTAKEIDTWHTLSYEEQEKLTEECQERV